MPLNGFRQHSFSPRVNPSWGLPVVYITPLALAKMWHITDIASSEVGWLGSVKRTSAGDFLVEDVWLVKQTVSMAETELDDVALAQLILRLRDEDGGSMERAGSLHFWGHSHVNMGTTPSGQDERQVDAFADDCPYFIRCIVNKQGRLELSLFLFEAGIRVDDCEWRVYSPAWVIDRKDIEDEFKSLVSERKFTSQYHGYKSFGKSVTGFGGYGGYCGIDDDDYQAASVVLHSSEKEAKGNAATDKPAASPFEVEENGDRGEVKDVDNELDPSWLDELTRSDRG